jgi:1-acyl-sn-glycerol-3-phosphate acyltransferase
VVAETDVGDLAGRAGLEREISRTATHLLGAAPDQVVLVEPGALLRTPSGKIRRTATRQAFEGGSLASARPPAAVQLVRSAVSGLAAAARRRGRRSGALLYGAYAWVAAVMTGAVASALVHLPVSPPTRWRLVRAAGRALCSVTGITVHVDGVLPIRDGVVVVANHESFLDGAALLLASPEPLVFVTSTDLENHRLFGHFLRTLGCVFVERGQPGRSQQDLALLEGAVAGRRHRLMVFPEGSIVRAPGVRRFHLGAFAVATAAGCPVVPIGIRGTRDILRPGTWLPCRGTIEVVVGSPIQPDGHGFASEVALAEQARHAVARLSGEPELT